jgi:tRNA dimethylallyltransferase
LGSWIAGLSVDNKGAVQPGKAAQQQADHIATGKASGVDSALPPVVCLMGTTATGKTDAAACLYDHFDAEIVSVDSSLVYQGMDIGTAKPNDEFLRKYPHHLINIRHPNDTYSAADFYRDAFPLVASIRQQGKVPVLAGGTHFYFSALLHGLPELPPADPELRARIDQESARLGWPRLHQRLAALDEKSAKRIDPMDAQRIQRALEIVLLSGKTVAEHNQLRKPGLSGEVVKIALNCADRSYLHERIEKRFQLMLKQGLQAEVELLLDRGANPELPAMRMIGYRQTLEFLQGDITYSELEAKGVAATRQLAKRQLTWLRNQPNMIWWTNLKRESQSFSDLVEFVRYFVR